MSAAFKDTDRLLKLMAYADGELDAAERTEVEGWLARDVDAVRATNELAGLGELVTLGHASTSDAKAIASFDIADAVMASVAAEQKKAEQQAPVDSNVRSLDTVRARKQQNRKVGGMVAAALALAASVFLLTRNKEELPMARAPIPTVQPAPAPASGGVDVDVVQTPGNSVGVYYVPSESSLTTSVVVWVDEGEK